jgi:hypothetical protein
MLKNASNRLLFALLFCNLKRNISLIILRDHKNEQIAHMYEKMPEPMKQN